MASLDQATDALAGLSLDVPREVHFEEKKSSDTPVHKDDLLRRKQLDEMFEQVSAKKLEELQLIEMPFENVDLYPHQKQGISWLVHNEASTDMPSWFTKEEKHGKTRYRCSVTRLRTKKKPNAIRGSILADDMGLGSKWLVRAASSSIIAESDF